MRFLCIANVYALLKDFILGESEPKGAPGFYKFLRKAEERGHEVHVIFRTNQPMRTRASDRIFFYPGNARGWWTRVIPFGRFNLDVLSATYLGLKMNRQTHFDVIYGQLAYGAAVAYLLNRLTGIPNATRQYGSLLYGRHGANKWRMLRQDLQGVLPFVLPTQHLIVTQDGTQADRVAELFAVPEDRLHVWYNGFDRSLLDQDKDTVIDWPVPDGARSLLWIGRLTGWKRPDWAIELLGELSRDDTHLVFVGEGNWVPYLIGQAEGLGLSSRVHFVGAVPHHHVPAYCRKSDLFISLLQYSNLSNTVIEAMACGCCVVAMNEGDTRLLIQHGETGFLVDRELIDSLPDLVDHLLDNHSLRTHVGACAQAFVEQHLPSWDERMDWELSLLESLVV